MIAKIRRGYTLRILSAGLAAWLVLTSFVPLLQGRIILKAGTSVTLETTSLVSSKLVSPGQTIELRVRNDVRIGNKVVIKAGAPAKAQVVRVQRAKALGKPGYLEIEARSVTAVDGTEVPLSGGRIYVEGEEKQTLSVVLGLFVCLLFLLMKGKDAEIPPGYTVSAQVASDVEINTN